MTFARLTLLLVDLDQKAGSRELYNSINRKAKEITMRAHQIMTRNVITIGPRTSIVEAAKLMLDNHLSGLPVLDEHGKLAGIVSEGDFLRRSEIGTQRKRPRVGCNT
jgi:CBS domain-containing protein